MQALREKINYRHVGLAPLPPAPVPSTKIGSRVSERSNKGNGKFDLTKNLLEEAGDKHRDKLPPGKASLRERIPKRRQPPSIKPASRVSERDTKGMGQYGLTKMLLEEAGEDREDLPASQSILGLKDRKKKGKTKTAPVKVAKPVKANPPSATKVAPVKKAGRPKDPDKVSQTPWSNIRAGDRLGIYWDGDHIYYPCTVEAIDGSKVWILYDDQEKECLDLSKNKFFRWKECLNKRLHPAAPLDANTQPLAAGLKTKSVSSKSSPEHSIQTTQDSTDSGSVHRNSKAKEGKTISIHGTFTAPVVVPACSLASFLRKKIESPPTSKKVIQTTVAPESAFPVAAPSLTIFLRKKMETPPTDRVTSTESASEPAVAAPSLMSFLSRKMQAPSVGITK